MDQEQAQGLPEMWAIVELFGHQRVAGKVTTLNLGPACLIRVTIPECTREERAAWDYPMDGGPPKLVGSKVTTPEHDRLFGVGAIYAINPCTEDTVRKVLQTMDAEPLSPYDLNRVEMLTAAPAEPVVDSMENSPWTLTVSEAILKLVKEAGGRIRRYSLFRKLRSYDVVPFESEFKALCASDGPLEIRSEGRKIWVDLKAES